MFNLSPAVTYLIYFIFLVLLISYMLNTNLELLSPEAQLFIAFLFAIVTYVLLHDEKDYEDKEKKK
jgi:positive regulator of sigma E activity